MKFRYAPVLLLFLISYHSYCQVGPFNYLSYIQINVFDAIPADMDNDGDMDIIATSTIDGKLAWYENLGNGEFGIQKAISWGTNDLLSLRVGDLDNDGDLDAVVASNNNTCIMYFVNPGDGNLTSGGFVTNTIGGIYAVELVDVDGDLDLDVVTNTNSDIVKIINNGGFSFSMPQLVVGGMSDVRQIRSADLDGDSDMDLVVADYANDRVYAMFNSGTGTFTSTIVTSLTDGACDVHIIDLDGDLDLDIVSSSQVDGKYAWYANLGGGTFGAQQVIYSPGANNAWRIGVGDADLDGDNDIFFSIYNEIRVLENTGSATFNAPVAITPGYYYVNSIAMGELDGNPGLEVIFGSNGSGIENKVVWARNLGSLNFDFPDVLTSHAPDANTIQFFDVDDDGVEDVLYGFQTGIRWNKNLGGGEFARHQNLITPTNNLNAVEILPGDMDNDGDLDLVYMAGSYGIGTIFWYENLGNGVYVEDTITTMMQGCSAIDLADLDGDLDLDVLYCYGWTGINSVGWIENLGGGNFGLQQPLGPEALDVKADDVDNDGDLDIIAALQTTTKLVWHENLGGATFSAAQTIHDSTDTPMSITLIDMDNDNDNDLIILYNYNLVICYFENLGNGSYGNRQYIEYNSSQTAIEVFDMDNDGDKDLIYGQGMPANVDQLLWRENLGNGTFSQEMIAYDNWQGNRPSAICGADVDDDGDLDLLMGSWYDDVIGWHENYFYYNTQISGRLFVDQNQNLVYDSSDFFIPQLGVVSTPQSDFAFTYADGKYFMNFSDTAGTYLIEPQQLQYWSVITSPTDTTITLNSGTPVIDSLNFGFYPDTIITVLNPELVGAFSSCNTIVNYWLNVQNTGTTIPSGVIHLQLDDSLTFIASNVPADSVQGNNYFWSYDSLYYFTDTLINVQVLMPDFNSMGDTLSSMLEVYEDSSGTLLLNNTDTLDQTLVCAYDPNDKIADPYGIDSLGYILLSTDKLEYTIRFQNTGTDTAQNVVIKDILDPNLVWNFLTYLASSHDVTISADQYGEVTFNFANIMLPDSNVNEIASHGFVKYRIEIVPGTPNNTSIYNTAEIYFDQNPPVITNTKINTLMDCDFIVAINLSEALQDTLCSVSPPMPVPDASPIGGVYYGTGVSGYQFYPANADIGPNTIYYQYDNTDGCSWTDSVTITVLDCASLFDHDDLGFSVYPNPTDGTVYIEFPEINKGLYMRQLDLSGRIIKEEKFAGESNTHAFEVIGTSGIYLLEVRSSKGSVALVRVVKE